MTSVRKSVNTETSGGCGVAVEFSVETIKGDTNAPDESYNNTVGGGADVNGIGKVRQGYRYIGGEG